MAGSLVFRNIFGSRKDLRCCVLFLLLACSTPLHAALTLEEAVAQAADSDPWLRGSELRELSLIHISEPTRPAPLSRMPSSA